MRRTLAATLVLGAMLMATSWLLVAAVSTRPVHGVGPGIVDGTPTGYTRWQGVVNLYNQGPGCTGVLVDPEVVLASGHCTPGFITNPMQVLIAGGADLRDPQQVVPYARVVDVATAPGFETGDWMADLAALRLEMPVVGVPYYPLFHAPRPQPPADAKVVGYGTTARGLADHGVHREGDVVITDPFLGDPEFNRRLVIFTGPSMVCYGDSGAPVFTEWAGEWQVLAIAVRTDSCEPAGLGFAVYMALYRDWLAEVVQRWTGHGLPEHGGELAPTATPTPSPTSTPTPTPFPSPTATATPTPTPGPAFLPWLAQAAAPGRSRMPH